MVAISPENRLYHQRDIGHVLPVRAGQKIPFDYLKDPTIDGLSPVKTAWYPGIDNPVTDRGNFTR